MTFSLRPLCPTAIMMPRPMIATSSPTPIQKLPMDIQDAGFPERKENGHDQQDVAEQIDYPHPLHGDSSPGLKARGEGEQVPRPTGAIERSHRAGCRGSTGTKGAKIEERSGRSQHGSQLSGVSKRRIR